MALDSREKRASVLSVSQSAPPSPTPNALLDQEWRQESGWGYSGILVGPPPPPPPIPPPVVTAAVGVLVIPGVDRRVFARWERDVREFWIRYFIDVVGLSLAQAELQTDAILDAAEQMQDQSPRDFWREYFRKVEIETQKAYLIQLEDEEILTLL